MRARTAERWRRERVPMEAFARSDAESPQGMDGLIAELLSSLIRIAPEDFATATETALRRIGERLDVDIATIVEFDGGGHSTDGGFHWVRRTLASADVVADIKRLAELMHSLDVGSEPMILERIPEQLPRELLAKAAFDAAHGLSMKSAVIIPMIIPGHCSLALAVGVCTGYRSWPERFIEGLRLLTEVILAAWQRRTQELALRQSREEVARLSIHPNGDHQPIAVLPERADDVPEALDETSTLIEHTVATVDRSIDPAPPGDHRSVRVSAAEEIVGTSAPLRAALARLSEVASSDSTVLLLGETGTGKELFAKVLHAQSPRRHAPLVCVNCAALPPTLIESELFGHERGAFTGAVAQRQGRFEVAHRGTLFLDEIGDLPLDLQAKLLRVLQEGEFERLGTSRTRKVDVRIVAATHRDLEEAVADGGFRDDLYYRLNVFPVRLPPLRERRDDIPDLVWYLIRKRQAAVHRRIDRVPPEAMELLQHHSWPGNIRELENVIERALIHSTDNTLILRDDDIEVAGNGHSAPSADATTLSFVERAHIEEVLRACGWRINGVGNAAERLGMHPNTLRFRMKKLGIVRAPGTSPRSPLARLR
jgi:formate hydrogenlyase transcriptional activator